jgi:DNA-binding IclR family transcriptional regulator
MTETKGRRRGIQSVEIGMRVLAAIAAQTGPAALSVVAKTAGLTASQAHRYLSSLIAAGMARQDPATSLYDLDAGAIHLGLAALGRLDIFASADAIFQAFARETGRTCLLAVWGNAGPTIVRWFPGRPPVITSLAIGSVMPLLGSATGRAFLGFHDPAAIEDILRRETATSGIGPPEVTALRLQVRRDVCAEVQGDLIPGLRAVGVPVFDLQGRLALVATAIASGVAEQGADDAAGAALKRACRSMTEALGGRWPEGTDSSIANQFDIGKE